MALRVVGEEYSIVQGLDILGWLREIAINDSQPGLKITQSGAGKGLQVVVGSSVFEVAGADTIHVGATSTAGIIKLAQDRARVEMVPADNTVYLTGDASTHVGLKAGGAVILFVRNSGRIGVNAGTNPSATFHIRTIGSAWEALRLQALNGQTSDLFSITDSAENILYKFNKSGYPINKRTSAPADADLSANEMAIWFDPTAGAAKLMVKAKNASGTVVTGSLALA